MLGMVHLLNLSNLRLGFIRYLISTIGALVEICSPVKLTYLIISLCNNMVW